MAGAKSGSTKSPVPLQTSAITEAKHLPQNQTNSSWLYKQYHECEYEDSSCNPGTKWVDWTYFFIKFYKKQPSK